MEIDPGDRMITDQEEVIMDYEEEVEMSAAGTAEEDAMMDDEVGAGDGENDHDMDVEPIPMPTIQPATTIDAAVPIPSFFPSTAVPTITTTPPLATVGGLSSQPFPSPPAPETEMTPVNEEPPIGVSMTEPKQDELAPPFTAEEGEATSNPIPIPSIPPPTANSSALPIVPSSPASQVPQSNLEVNAESSAMGGASDPYIDLSSGVSTDPSSSTAAATNSSSLYVRPVSDEDRAPASTSEDNEGEGTEKVVEENDDEEEYFEDDEKTIDAHTLPPICLHLPGLGARALFSPLPKDEFDMNLPVWLKDRQEDLAGATLAEVWSAIREELSKEKMDKSGEMVLVEKQMELRMGDDDKHLQAVTLLDFLQVHHDCALPLPVQLYLVFEPSRFIARFHAIKKEVEDRRGSTVSDEGQQYIYEDGATKVEQTANDDEGDEQEREEPADDEGEYDGDYPDEDENVVEQAEAEAEEEVQPEEVPAEEEVQEEEEEEVQAEEEEDEEEETEEEADPESQEQLESEPRAAVDHQAQYGGSDLARERRQVDWARAHGDSGPAMPKTSRIILQRSRSSSTEDEPKAKRVRSRTAEEPPHESEDETPADGENNGDESGEGEDEGHRETVSSASSRETHSNHDKIYNMQENQIRVGGSVGSATGSSDSDSDAIVVHAGVNPNQGNPVSADSEVEVDEGYGSDNEEGVPDLAEIEDPVDAGEYQDEGFEDDLFEKNVGDGIDYGEVGDVVDFDVPLDEQALFESEKPPIKASNPILRTLDTTSPALQDFSPTATNTNLPATQDTSESPGSTPKLGVAGTFESIETITEEEEDEGPDGDLFNEPPAYYPFGAETVSPAPSTDNRFGDGASYDPDPVVSDDIDEPSFTKTASLVSPALTFQGDSDELDDSLEAVWPRGPRETGISGQFDSDEDNINYISGEISNAPEESQAGDGPTDVVDDDRVGRSSPVSSLLPSSVTLSDESLPS